MSASALDRSRPFRESPLPCQDEDPELWFAQSPSDVETAKALCLQCPLQAACLAGALRRGEPWGVWGGQLVVQGAVVARKRPPGRPRKDEVAAVTPWRPTRPGCHRHGA